MADYDDGSLLECPVCMETYDRLHHLPKMMPCLHTTCIACVATMLGVPTNHEPSAPVYEPTTTRNRVLQYSQSSSGGSRPSSSAPPVPLRLPLLPKPISAVVKKAYEIPKNTVFRCPLCRSTVNSNSVQTNRYIIAHLRDLKRLGRSEYTQSTVGPSSRGTTTTTTSTTSQQPQQSVVPLPENWCNTCCYPAKEGCQEHDKIPLAQWTAQKVQTLQERTSLMQIRLRQHEDILSTSNREVQDVLSALNAVTSKVDTQRREGQRLQGTLKALQDDWARQGAGEGTTPQGRVEQLRRKAISLKEQTKLLHDLKREASRLEDGGQNGVVMWQSAKKLYVKKDGLTFSITKESEDYIA